MTPPLIFLRGGGDLASGVAYRLHKAGFPLLITECEQPLAVRRLVSFAEAVYRGRHTVEGVTACRVETPLQARHNLTQAFIPVLVDPDLRTLSAWNWLDASPPLLIDARMTKRPPQYDLAAFRCVIGLGPGFTVGQNCHAVIETNRGHFLGRLYWQGSAEADTGIPEAVLNRQAERVLRAPCDGILRAHVSLGSIVPAGTLLAEVNGQPVRAPFDGLLRGLLHDGLPVKRGLKIGDLDPRRDPRYAHTISDKALSIGGGALEAIMTLLREAE